MKLEADAPIAFPREVVFAAYRDRLTELVPFLPNVRSITVESRQDGVQGVPERTDLVNRWQAKADIPKVLQGLIKPEALTWIDRASWDERDHTCRWEIELGMFTEQVRCGGTNTYRVDGDRTVLEIRGHLDVDASGLGVPRLLAGTVAPQVERFVVNLIRPNLLSVAQGLERYLQGS